MSWLIGGILCFLGYLALHVAGEALAEMLLPVFSPLRLLYRPPHGGAVLVITWLLALAGTVLGFGAVATVPGVIAFMASIPLATLASAAYRDQTREADKDLYLPARNVRP